MGGIAHRLFLSHKLAWSNLSRSFFWAARLQHSLAGLLLIFFFLALSLSNVLLLVDPPTCRALPLKYSRRVPLLEKTFFETVVLSSSFGPLEWARADYLISPRFRLDFNLSSSRYLLFQGGVCDARLGHGAGYVIHVSYLHHIPKKSVFSGSAYPATRHWCLREPLLLPGCDSRTSERFEQRPFLVRGDMDVVPPQRTPLWLGCCSGCG